MPDCFSSFNIKFSSVLVTSANAAVISSSSNALNFDSSSSKVKDLKTSGPSS